MREVGAFEAKNKLGTLLDWVEAGEEVLITRRGKPVARLVSAESVFDREKARQAADRVRARAAVEGLRRNAVKLEGGFNWEEWKAYRDEGRK
ncbi:MAG: type II toxin-antitoxin system Phd/YefM family antitoxin [Pseudomonadota bacterium]